MTDSSNLLPRQGSFISFENLSNAEDELTFKYNGLRVYINSEDKFYYYKGSAFELEPQSSNVSSADSVIKISDYGADPTGVADSSTAIQNAITAAVTQGINSVFLGVGVFKCNITIPENFNLYGAGGGFFVNFFIPPAPYDTDIYPTVLIPNSTSSPVITVPSIYGVRLADFAIIGSVSKLGQGITLSNGVNYCGSNMSLDRVSVRGFDRGLANYGGVDITYTECMFTCSTYNVHLQRAADNLAPSDNNTFLNCVTGGPDSTWNFYISAARGINIIGGDHNLASHIMYMGNGSVVNWMNGNSEQITSNLFELNSGYLNIEAGRFNVIGGIGGNDALLHVTGPTVFYSIGTIAYDGNGSGFLSSSYGTLIKTAGTEYPRTAPPGFLIQRYTSTSFTTLRQTEFTSRIFRPLPVIQSSIELVDNFVNGYSTPFGQYGWVLTTLGGSGGQGRFPSSNVQNLFGALEIVTISGSGNDLFRLSFAREIFTANIFPEWEMSFILNCSNAANTILRAGLFSNDSFTVTNATNASPIVITTSTNHNLIDGMEVFNTSIGGNTNANGRYFIDVLSPTTFALYTNSALTTPRAGNAAYTSGGISTAVTPTNGVGVGFHGVNDSNIFAETYTAGVVNRTNTNVATSAVTSTTNGVEIRIRRFANSSSVGIGYGIQIGSNNETLITTALSAGYLIPAVYVGSANANFATVRIDRFSFRN